MKNIVVVNLESVNRATYDLLPRDTKMQWAIWDVPSAYSMDARNSAIVTGTFFMMIMQDQLLKRLKELGYTTVFVTEWSYMPTKQTFVEGDTNKPKVVLNPNRKTIATSWFDDWLVERFDHYVNTYEASNVSTDFNKTLMSVEHLLDEPYFLMIQAHDTHMPFKSKGVKNWFDFFKELEGLIDLTELKKQENLNEKSFVTALYTLTDRQKIKFNALPNADKIKDTFYRARLMQVEALEYVLGILKGYVNSDMIWHFIGDHMTCLGEFDRFGNVHNGMFEEEMVRTPWLTNQNLDRSKTYTLGNLPQLLLEVLNG